MAQLAVVTGASSGIGREFAIKLSSMGYKVLLSARRQDRLLQLQKELAGDSDICIADVGSGEGIKILTAHIRELIDQGDTLSVLINNAGFGLSGRFTETDEDRELQMIDVNVKAVHSLTKQAIRLMSIGKNKQGNSSGDDRDRYILNVASSAGLLPAGPYMATYYATKAYVTSLTRAIAHELRVDHSHIHISCLCPGPVDTEFNDVADVVFALKGIPARECASYAIDQLFRNKTVIVPTLRMKFVCTFNRFIPGTILIPMIAHQQHKKMGR